MADKFKQGNTGITEELNTEEFLKEELITDERYQQFGLATKTEFTETELVNLKKTYPTFEDFYKKYLKYTNHISEVAKYNSKKQKQLNKKEELSREITELNNTKIISEENDGKLSLAKDNLIDVSESQKEALDFIYKKALREVDRDKKVIDSKIAYKSSIMALCDTNIEFFNSKDTSLKKTKDSLLTELNKQLEKWGVPTIKEES